MAVGAGMFKSSHRRGHWNVFNKQFTDLVMNQILLSRGLENAVLGLPPSPHPLSGFWGQVLYLLSVPSLSPPPHPTPGLALLLLPTALENKLHSGRASAPFPLFPAPALCVARGRACQTRDWWFGRPRLGRPQCQIGRKHLGKAHR